MSLPDLDLRHSTAGNIAPAKLKLCGEHVLGYPRFLSKESNILTYFLFDRRIHISPFCTYLGTLS